MIVRVRGIKKVRAASGKIYYYDRATKERIDPERLRSPPRGRGRGLGTVGALVTAYKASPEFAGLADRTRGDYQKVFDWLKAIDRMPIAQLDGAAMLAIRDKAFAQRKRRFANHVTQVIGTVMNWGRPRKLSAGNPLAGQRGIKIARPKELPRANRPWSDAEAEAVLSAATGGLKLGIALAVYAGMRGGDIVRVTWSIYDGQNLEWRQGKTGDEVWLPALTELRELLDGAERVAPTIVTSVYGRPLTEAGLRKAFRTLILRLQKAKKVAPGLTLHGRRHTLGDMLADLGADPRMIAAVLGHRHVASAAPYTAGADRKKAAAAAVHLLETERERRAGGFGKNGKTGAMAK